jgi:hypothetical protein
VPEARFRLGETQSRVAMLERDEEKWERVFLIPLYFIGVDHVHDFELIQSKIIVI